MDTKDRILERKRLEQFYPKGARKPLKGTTEAKAEAEAEAEAEAAEASASENAGAPAVEGGIDAKAIYAKWNQPKRAGREIAPALARVGE